MPSASNRKERTTPAVEKTKQEAPADPEPEITLAEIEALLKSDDLRAALIDAQILLQKLIDRGVSESDPRRRRIQELINLLQEKLMPKPVPPPPYVDEFRALVQKLHEALQAENLDAARTARAKADAILAAHPKETRLAAFTSTYLVLKAKLHEFEMIVEGLKRTEKLFAQARDRALTGQVTEALECEAHAKFLAFFTPLNEAEENRLKETAKKLAEVLLLARGQRAVEEAERCLKEGDADTLRKLVAEARAYLPGLRDPRVEKLLARAHAAAKKPPPRRSGSPFGQEIAFRFLYEHALQLFAEGQVEALLDACREAQQFLASLPQPQTARAKKLSDLVFEVLEQKVTSQISLPDVSPALPERLAQARKLLDLAGPWRAEPAWQRLDTFVRQRSDRSARLALERAEELAKKDLLEQAIKAAEPVPTLATKEVAARAQELIKIWKAEIDLRASLAAQDEHWKKIDQLRKESQVFETWREVKLFERRFPKSPRQKELQALLAELAPAVAKKVESMLAELDALLKASKGVAFRKSYEALVSAPVPEPFQAKVASYSDLIAQLNKQAEGRFTQLKKLYGLMISADQYLKLMEELPKVLDLNPAHEEAQKLLEEARRRCQAYAEKLLDSADFLRKTNRQDRYRERLKEVICYDPDGPSGAKARQLLKESAV